MGLGGGGTKPRSYRPARPGYPILAPYLGGAGERARAATHLSPAPSQQGPPGAVFRFHKLREGPRRQRERVDEDIGATRDRGRPGGARESCAAPPGPRGDPPPKSHVT